MPGIKNFLGEATIYGLGSVLSRLFAFVLIPIYIDNLGKNLYANVTLILLTFTLITFFLTLNSGVFFYYYEYKNKRIKKSIFASWIAYQIGVILFFLTLFYFAYPSISILFEGTADSDSIRKAFFYMLLSLWPYMINNTYFNKCRIDRKPIKAVVITISEALLLLILILLLVKVFELGIEGVFLAQLSSRSIVAIAVLVVGFWKAFQFKLISYKLIGRILNYSWPFFLTSSFFWLMSSIDKFMGTQLLESREYVAYLVLAGQITLPIAIFVDVIRQAYGPFVMSIRKEADASEKYVSIFSFVVFIGAIISVGLITISPFAVDILANESFYPSLSVIPYFACAATINLMTGQFGLGLNLTKKTGYIAFGFIAGGISGFTLNYYLQTQIGMIGAGIAQISSYVISSVIIYFFSRRYMKIDYEFSWAFSIMLILAVFSIIITKFANSPDLATIDYSYYIIAGLATLILLLIMGNTKYRFLNRFKNNNG